VFPQVAASARVQGIVIIEGTVGATGQAGDVRVLRSIPLLDNAAVDAVRQWRFAIPASGTSFTALINFVLSDIPAANDAPATSVGWPPADFALYYQFECRGDEGALVATSRSVNAVDIARGIPAVSLRAEDQQRLSLLLIQEGFFNITGATTERARRVPVQLTAGRVVVTVSAKPAHVHGISTHSRAQPQFHHELMVRAYGVWRTAEWAEPIAEGDQRAAEAARVGAAVRRFFRSVEEKGQNSCSS
jgi:TonB family protein